MEELDAFLTSTMPKLRGADAALHSGDASARAALWSHQEPMTVFGAAVTKAGWGDIGATFDWLASSFSNCTSFEHEVLAAGAGGDLAYVAGIERTTASVGDSVPKSYSLRVTTIFRRENGEWKVVHHHGDPYDASTEAVVAKLSQVSTFLDRSTR
jgi:ketosteroid isomerase-like protein